MSTIATAAREYARRPADERFPSVRSMVDAASQQKSASAERTYNTKDLHAVAVDDEVKLQGPKGSASFTHWAFAQLCRFVGAPASYLREIPAKLAADCLNHGLESTPPSTDAVLLVQAPNGKTEPTIRSVTTDSYARVWDADLYGQVLTTIMDRDDRWQTPPTWSGEPAGAYRGDRDSFLILVNGGSIVTDPSLVNGQRTSSDNPGIGTGPSDGMYRGILIRNSEVGASSITIESILYRYICGNHMLWGAMVDRTFRRRHIGSKVTRDVVREINDLAWKFTHQSAARDEAIIRTLIDRELAVSKEAIIDELRNLGATKEQAIAAYESCERNESASPRSFWGIAQGLTRVSQDSGYQDGRYELDQLAAKVLARGRKLVAA